MGLFEKKHCIRCGKELGLIFGKIKVAQGHICKDCNSLLSPLLTGKSKLTLDDIEAHLKYREDNRKQLNTFKAGIVLGDYQKVYIDDKQRKFLVTSSNNYLENNIDVFSFDQISSIELNIEEEKEELFTQDEQGNDISYNPAVYKTSYTYKVEMLLNHPWVKELTIDVSNGKVEQEDKEKLLKVDNLANEIIARLSEKEFVEKKLADDDHWVCNQCGQENQLNSKFCTNCGTSYKSGQKFCGQCGEKLPANTKFCPNCGAAIN